MKKICLICVTQFPFTSVTEDKSLAVFIFLELPTETGIVYMKVSVIW